MPTSDWYPTVLGNLPPWHANLSVQAIATGVARGLSAGIVTQITADAVEVPKCVNYLEAVDSFAQAVTQFVRIMLRGDLNEPLPPVPTVPATYVLALGALAAIEARTRQYRGILVAAPGYTQEIGELYGIVPPAPGPLVTPVINSLVAEPGSVCRLRISRGGYDVVAVDSRDNGGAWSQVGICMTAEYIDDRDVANPVLREFRLQGMVDNARTGDFSQIAGVSTIP